MYIQFISEVNVTHEIYEIMLFLYANTYTLKLGINRKKFIVYNTCFEEKKIKTHGHDNDNEQH